MPALSSFQRVSIAVCSLSSIPILLFSQQYPIPTETPQILPAGAAHAEVGFGRYEDQTFPLSGLEGTLTRLGNLRFGFSYDNNVELQFDGTLRDILDVKSRHDAINSALATTNSVTGDIGDFTLWTKFRLISEYHFFSTVSIRFGVQLPDASNRSGLGVNAFDFYSSFLLEKHFGGIRWVANAGLGILGSPAELRQQHEELIYAFGSYVPLGEKLTLALETAGRTGHQGPGIYRLANADAGVQTMLAGLSWKLLGVLSFAPSDNSKGAEIVAGYDFAIIKDAVGGTW
ncbi:MAG: hypothetical protein WBW71_00700 [Bacteroidota bacterium]